jgi:hypothetical protein
MNSKTTDKANAAGAGVLEEFTRLREVLTVTHSEIPRLLAREQTIGRALGLNDSEALRKELAEVTTERQSAVRRRGATIGAIVEMQGALQAERAAVERSRQEYAAGGRGGVSHALRGLCERAASMLGRRPRLGCDSADGSTDAIAGPVDDVADRRHVAGGAGARRRRGGSGRRGRPAGRPTRQAG